MSISKIYFRGHNTGEFSGVTVASCDYGDLESKRADEDIAGADGTVTTHANGRHYKSRQITIVFNVKATPTTVEATLSALREWLSGGSGELSDDYNAGWAWKNAEFVSAHTDYLDMFRGCAQLTVRMTADPRAGKPGEVNERVLRFTATGNATLVLTDNSAYSLTRGGATETGTLTVTAPYKYRLVVFAEGVPTITLNGDPLAADTVFTMPAGAEIAIAQSGYGYFELWHDTRTGVRA